LTIFAKGFKDLKRNLIIFKLLRQTLRGVVAVSAITIAGVNTYALPPTHYASSSALAEGKWIRVSVEQEGMHFISNSTLRQMGFKDPAKVNVYGFGGGMLSETLDKSMSDDLPMQPVTRTQGGIIFHAVHNVLWSESKYASYPYSHTKNLYSETSYYFLSDREPSQEAPEALTLQVDPSATEITSFLAPFLHEQDLATASNTGAYYLGEDFRTQTSQKFTFQLPGNIGSSVTTRINFGAANTSTVAIGIKANGVKLTQTASDNVQSIPASSDTFIRNALTIKQFDCSSDKLDLEISYDYTGVIKLARLDYIEGAYTRSMTLDGAELTMTHIVDSPVTFVVSGLDESSEIWDITDPAATRKVNFTLSGDKGRFTVTETGLHRYVAFNPAKVTRTTVNTTIVANQNIHGLETPDYVIITPTEYASAAAKIAALHEERGLKTLILNPQDIYNEFSSGSAEVTAFRKMLKMWHDRGLANGGGGAKYCLILSRPTYDNKALTQAVRNCGYPRIPIWCNYPSPSQSFSFSTDDYIGMLDDNDIPFSIENDPTKGNRIYTAVGRFSVTSQAEADRMADKLIKYIKTPNYGGWRNQLTFISDDQDGGIHIEQNNEAIENTQKNGNGANFNYYKLYTDAYPLVYTGTGPTYPEPKRLMFQRFNDSAIISYAGHANPRSWTHENLFTWTEMNNLTNTNLPFLLAYTCEYLRWDDDEVSGAEMTWKDPDHGFIGMMVPCRTSYMGPNNAFNQIVSKNIFERTPDGKAKTWGEVMIDAKNEYLEKSNEAVNTLKYAFLGDPALPVLNPECEVRLDRIGDTDLSAGKPADLPELGASASTEISGSIYDSSGALKTDFNGIVEITLYDAEVTVTTNGNGSHGEKITYNDRKTKLFNTRVRAEGGKWQTTLRVPLEIENNYSPARISMYAYSDNGIEANGACESLYVYGYDNTSAPDTEGPEITFFGLNNREHFEEGALVNTNPVVFATFRDESGINVSDAGIGHKITLTLDDRTTYDDVSQYFLADIDEDGKGSVTYPLSDLEPGVHNIKLTVWDNANNSSSASTSFQVGIGVAPTIYDISTDVNPAHTSVTFTVSTSTPLSRTDFTIEVFDLNGRKMWSSQSNGMTDIDSSMNARWDLTDQSGHRVPRGIYLYRATVATPEGMTRTKTKKLAVAAP